MIFLDEWIYLYVCVHCIRLNTCRAKVDQFDLAFVHAAEKPDSEVRLQYQ